MAADKAKNTLKSRMDDLILQASRVPFEINHPLRVVQAGKSIIGLDRKIPCEKLLKWLEEYLTGFPSDFNVPELNEPVPETIAYPQLEQIILDRNLQKAEDYLNYLLRVADSRHIAEFLLEFATDRSIHSTLFCWSAFRCIQFVNKREIAAVLFLCLEELFDESAGNMQNTELSILEFELYCHQFQIRQTDMVRHSKILPKIQQQIEAMKPGMDENISTEFSAELLDYIQSKGMSGILTWLNAQDIKVITPHLILILDAVRSALTFAKPDFREQLLTGVVN